MVRGGTTAPSVAAFARRLRVDRKRVHGGREFVRECRVNQPVTLDPALPLEGLRYDIDTEM